MSVLLEVDEDVEGIPVCGANLSSPVVDTAYYIDDPLSNRQQGVH